MAKKLKGYGIKPNGEHVDIGSPDFRTGEYTSVVLIERLNRRQMKKFYPKVKIPTIGK